MTMAKDRFEIRAFDVFNKKFEDSLSRHNFNHKKTFYAITEELDKALNFQIFSSYESFKNARSRRRKKHHNK